MLSIRYFSINFSFVEKTFATPDDQLLRLIGRGDEKAFNVLFERYRNRLYSYLVKVTKSKESAEEATLDVFLKIWNARQALHEIANFEAFLFRVVHNKAIDCLRRAKTSQMMRQELWAGLEELADAAAADQKILNADTEIAIHTAVNQLSPQRQQVFRLSREEYLSYDQIAERMQISRHTVRNHVSAALQFIRSHLDNGVEIATLIIATSKIH